MKIYLLLTVGMIISTTLAGQNSKYQEIEYKIIAEGNDSPYENLQIVCFNKFFNLEQLPKEFRIKYDLANKQLYKKKMLVQIFYQDKENIGIDKIELERIEENDSELIIRYNHINSDTANDSISQSPFLVVQIPKSRKAIKFIANHKEIGKGTKLYIDN